MPRTKSTSSSQRASRSRETRRLVRVPLERLLPHPANPNVMSDELLEKLAANIALEGDYEPLTVRPHPSEEGCQQILGGHNRKVVLERLGYTHALCYIWPCDDETALRLLVTLNRLEGQDEPLKRAELLKELAALASPEELAELLPEDATSIRRSIDMLDLDLDLDALLSSLTKEAGPASDWRAVTFAVTEDDEREIERAVAIAVEGLEGKNRRGRALALVCREYVGADHA